MGVGPFNFTINARTAASVIGFGLASLLGLAFAAAPARPILLPAIVSVNVLLAFLLTLKNREGHWPVAELGTVCLLISSLYAVVPLLGFWLGDLEWSPQSDSRLYDHPPSLAQVAGVGWRYTLYLASFAVAYLWSRGRSGLRMPGGLEVDRATTAVVALVVAGITGYYVAVSLVFGVSFNPSYASLREGSVPGWDALPRVIRQIASYGEGILLVSKFCLLAVLFQQWARRRWRFALILWLALEVLSAASRLGARRDTAMLLIAAVLLFHRMVRPLSFLQGGLGGTALLGGLLAFGVARDFGQERASWTMANEFQILFGNACDLQTRRIGGLEVPWQVYLSDLLRLVPSRWQPLLPFKILDPSDWYLEVLGQQDTGVGLMFGVVAQAAIGWDQAELVARGAVLGLIFAAVHRWYVRRSTNLWVTAFYLFLCAWCYYTVRATTFHIVYFVIYRFLPAIALMWTARMVLKPLGHSTGTGARSADRGPIG